MTGPDDAPVVDLTKRHRLHPGERHIFGSQYRDSPYHWCDCGARGRPLNADELAEHAESFGLAEPLPEARA